MATGNARVNCPAHKSWATSFWRRHTCCSMSPGASWRGCCTGASVAGPRGGFSWKHESVFLSETLMGERVGLEPIDERYFTIYFAEFPLGRFDSYQLQVNPLPSSGKQKG